MEVDKRGYFGKFLGVNEEHVSSNLFAYWIKGYVSLQQQKTSQSCFPKTCTTAIISSLQSKNDAENGDQSPKPAIPTRKESPKEIKALGTDQNPHHFAVNYTVYVG